MTAAANEDNFKGCISWYDFRIATLVYTLLYFVIFVVFLQLGFFVEEQFLDLKPSRGIGSDFEQFPIVLNVLARHKAVHDLSKV
jgi:hypothetical protein